MATTYPAGKRPRIRVMGRPDNLSLTLKRINSRTAYAASPFVVGELAYNAEDVTIIRHADGTPVLETERWPPLTPYDTGERLEPAVWVTPDRRRPEEHDRDRYGKVDFNDDTNTTIATVHAERVETCHLLVVYSHETDSEVRINLDADLDIFQRRIECLDEAPQAGAADWQGRTPRGFGYSEFSSDKQGSVLIVQESSLATRRMLWIGNSGLDRAHLDEGKVREIRDLLTSWLEGAV